MYTYLGLENENVKMRRLIDVYIRSSELNDPVWDIMDEDKRGDDTGGANNRATTAGSMVNAATGLDEQPKTDRQLYGFTRKGNTDTYIDNRPNIIVDDIANHHRR